MKTALVTGGSRGIGSAIALGLGKNFHVVVGYANSEDKANNVVKEIVAAGGSASTVQIDISNAESVDNAFSIVEKEYNSVDVLINNAGITQDNLAIRMSLDEWQKVININLTSTFLMSKFAIKKMLKNKSGKIVNITSVVGHTGNLGQANYTASKAGIVAMSKSLAIEYAKKNININCISPGFIKTAMTDKIDDKFKEVILSKIPSARLGEPNDIANAVLFLSSDQSNYINGETLHVNGGMYMA